MESKNESYEQISDYLRAKEVIDVGDISYLGTGFVNNNYLVNGSDGKFVLRMRRNDIPHEENRLENEFVIYSFLKHKEYPWVPRVRYFDPETPALLITYIPARQTSIEDLSLDELEQLEQQIAEYHTYTFYDFKEFCTRHQLPYTEPVTPIEDFERFESKRFKYLKKHFDNKAWLDWIAPHFKEYERRVYERSIGRARLIHGDIKSNILMDVAKKLWFIDWELGRFSYYDDLGCILSRRTSNKQLDAQVIDLYLKYSGKDRKTFEDELAYIPYTKYISSVLWSLWRYVETKEKDLPDSEMYLARAHKAKKEFEKEKKICTRLN